MKFRRVLRRTTTSNSTRRLDIARSSTRDSNFSLGEFRLQVEPNWHWPNERYRGLDTLAQGHVLLSGRLAIVEKTELTARISIHDHKNKISSTSSADNDVGDRRTCGQGLKIRPAKQRKLKPIRSHNEVVWLNR
jgi:hypothetical protein